MLFFFFFKSVGWQSIWDLLTPPASFCLSLSRKPFRIEPYISRDYLLFCSIPIAFSLDTEHTGFTSHLSISQGHAEKGELCYNRLFNYQKCCLKTFLDVFGRSFACPISITLLTLIADSSPYLCVVFKILKNQSNS